MSSNCLHCCACYISFFHTSMEWWILILSIAGEFHLFALFYLLLIIVSHQWMVNFNFINRKWVPLICIVVFVKYPSHFNGMVNFNFINRWWVPLVFIVLLATYHCFITMHWWTLISPTGSEFHLFALLCLSLVIFSHIIGMVNFNFINRKWVPIVCIVVLVTYYIFHS